MNYIKRTGINGVPNVNKCDQLKGGEGHKYKCVNLEKLYYKVFHEARMFQNKKFDLSALKEFFSGFKTLASSNQKNLRSVQKCTQNAGSNVLNLVLMNRVVF